ncbi:histone H3/H4 [Methanococcus maripaludis]|uniref:Histone H3/H4 n=1 Tax=Methanococcus maripaludis TaxID=39152 RepID=A0A7J9P1A1_METMI|nr:histone-like protein [Methanococcus maripaludis]MBA2851806.1 histone H3/H4 [Methanococcus maripaludis]
MEHIETVNLSAMMGDAEGETGDVNVPTAVPEGEKAATTGTATPSISLESTNEATNSIDESVEENVEGEIVIEVVPEDKGEEITNGAEYGVVVGGEVVVKEIDIDWHEFGMPNAAVKRIMKSVSDDKNISADAVEKMKSLAIEYIMGVTKDANARCEAKKRKTIMDRDIEDTANGMLSDKLLSMASKSVKVELLTNEFVKTIATEIANVQ